jgi:hypothetical protein
MKLAKQAIVIAAALAFAVSAAPAASAAGINPRPQMCPGNNMYEYHNAGSTNMDMVPYASAPGGHTLSITLTAGASVTGTIGGQVEGDANIIFAGAKASVNASISVSLSASVAYGDSWTVPSNWSTGELHAGASAQNFTWQYVHENGNCSTTVERSGSGREPYHLPAFWDSQG